MYIPAVNQMPDREEVVAFMKRFSFAVIINNIDGVPVATHLPFHISLKDDQVILTAHFAKANDQWQYLESTRSLVIFSTPHAYISPTHYERMPSVPTWNYIAVHAYGKARIIADPEQVMAILEQTIQDYEPAQLEQWRSFPENYKTGMMKGIVAFDIVVDDLQAKKKLSQNKNDLERQRIIETLSASKDTTETMLADYMRQDHSY